MLTMTEQRTRLLLLLNAITSIMSGLICLGFSGWIQSTLIPGAPVWLLLGSGVGLVGFGIFVSWISRKQKIPREGLREIFLLDVAWVVGSVILAQAMPDLFSDAGMIAWIAIALIVTDYAILEGLALWQTGHSQENGARL